MRQGRRLITAQVPLLAVLASIMAGAPASAAAGGHATAGLAHRVVWHSRAPLPVAQGGLATATIDRRILAIGGFSSDFRAALHTVQAYNPRTNRWLKLAPLPTARGDLAAAAADGRRPSLRYRRAGHGGQPARHSRDLPAREAHLDGRDATADAAGR